MTILLILKSWGRIGTYLFQDCPPELVAELRATDCRLKEPATIDVIRAFPNATGQFNFKGATVTPLKDDVDLKCNLNHVIFYGWKQ